MKHNPVEVLGATEVHSPELELLCAVIGCAVEDVRFAKRNGYVNDDQSILHIGNKGGQKNAAFLFVSDAYEFFRDGRLERMCCLISEVCKGGVEPTRIATHVLNGVSLHKESGFRVVDGNKKGYPNGTELTVIKGGIKS